MDGLMWLMAGLLIGYWFGSRLSRTISDIDGSIGDLYDCNYDLVETVGHIEDFLAGEPTANAYHREPRCNHFVNGPLPRHSVEPSVGAICRDGERLTVITEDRFASGRWPCLVIYSPNILNSSDTGTMDFIASPKVVGHVNQFLEKP